MATAPHLLLAAALVLAATPALSLAANPDGDGASQHVFRIQWAPDVNYTKWAQQREFHVGDWLDFRYQKDMYDVVQVNETAYAACDGGSPILSYGRGRNFPFRLNRTGRVYFICSRGYCWNGMKLSVLVQPPAPLTPAAAPAHGSAGDGCRRRAAAAVWLAALAASLGAAAMGTLPFRLL